MREHVESAHPELITRLQEAPHEIFSLQPVYTARTALSRQIREAVEIGSNTTGGVLLNNKEEFNRCLIPVLQVEGPRNPQPQPEPKITASQEQEEEGVALTLSKSRNKKRQGTTGMGSSKRQRVNNTQHGIARFLKVLEVTGTPHPPTQVIPPDGAEHPTTEVSEVPVLPDVHEVPQTVAELQAGQVGAEHQPEHQLVVAELGPERQQVHPELQEVPQSRAEQGAGQGGVEDQREHQQVVSNPHPGHQLVDPGAEGVPHDEPDQHPGQGVAEHPGEHQHNVGDQHHEQHQGVIDDNDKIEAVTSRGLHTRSNTQTSDEIIQHVSHPSGKKKIYGIFNASCNLECPKPIIGSAKHQSLGQLRKVRQCRKVSSKSKFMKNGTPYPDISKYLIRSKRRK